MCGVPLKSKSTDGDIDTDVSIYISVGLTMLSYIHWFLKLKKIYDSYNVNITFSYTYYSHRAWNLMKFSEKIDICMFDPYHYADADTDAVRTGLNQP